MKTTNKILIIVTVVSVLFVGFYFIFPLFMLTTTLSKPVTMQLDIPDKTDADTAKVRLKDTIDIIVMGRKVYFESNADGQKGIAAINSADLKNFLEKQRKIIGKNKCTITILPNKDTQYKDMVDLLDTFSVLELKRYAVYGISEKDLDKVKEYELSHKN
jgi:biopolymer transport protein ExbD